MTNALTSEIPRSEIPRAEPLAPHYPGAMATWGDTILQNISDAIIAVDYSWNVVFANPSAERLLRATSNELIGSPLKYCVPHVSSGAAAPISLDQLLVGTHNHPLSKKIWNITDRLGQQHELQCQVFRSDKSIDAEHAAVIFLSQREESVQSRVTKQKQNSRDHLTGLPDRFTFNYEFHKVLARAEHSIQKNHLCLINIGKLSVVNEVCGLAAGDELLKQVAKLIQRDVEKPDLLCRFSGKEFLLLCAGGDSRQTLRRMQRLVDGISAYRFIWEKRGFSIDSHIGIVPLESGATVDLSIAEAISACNAAKQSGNRMIHVNGTSNQYQEKYREDVQWVDRITHALDNDEFFLCAQTIEPTEKPSQTDARRYRHFEILVRMFSADNTTVPPGRFLPAAERFGLIEDIDKWVVSNTLKWLSNHDEILRSLDCCSINLSGKSLSDHRFLDFVTEQLDRYTVDPEKICFEITETAVVNNLTNAVKLMHSLRETGCKFALDDFGSGLSSFAYLKEFPIDYLKIDGLFVQDICNDTHQRSLIESINAMGKQMGFSTIAEFVENDETRQCLGDIGVDLVQGYGIERPKPLSELQP